MIIREEMKVNERNFIHTYSDENRYVVRDGVKYVDAIDPAEFDRTYTEGDYISPPEEVIPDDEELTDEQVATILTGGSL